MITHDNFNMFCWVWMSIAILLFPFLLHFTQPYGKHSKNNWGPMINNNLAWMLMELPALLVFFYFVSQTTHWQNSILLASIALWALHYSNRSIVFPLLIRTKRKKMPLIIMFFAIIFNSINGFINGYWLANFVPDAIDIAANTRVVIGIGIFIIGFGINQYHDHILINLRKNKLDGTYQIPHGGLFKYISCPNYLGEIISWFGFFVVNQSLPAFVFLIWTLCNLIPRALDNQRWYVKKFSDYPKSRKAIIPYLL